MRPLVITGATGWIGRALLAEVAARGELARVRLFGSREGVVEIDGAACAVRPLAAIAGADVAGAEVVHLAYLTREKTATMGEDAYVEANRAIDAALLDACRAATPYALFVASSGAARDAAEPYGRLKRAQEAAFLRYGAAAGVPVLAARIFALAGPYMNKLDSYALSDFLRQGLTDRRIRVRAGQPVFRAYLHAGDLARLALGALAQRIGADRPIDCCGSEVVEMGQVAHAAAGALGLAPDAVERAPLATFTPSAYLGDPASMLALALRLAIPLRSFAKQVADTADWLTLERF